MGLHPVTKAQAARLLGPTPIRRAQMRAFKLQRYSSVQPKWTEDLSEHLMLRTEKPKTLSIFKYPSFLVAAREAMGRRDNTMKLDESLKQRVHHPKIDTMNFPFLLRN